METQGNSGFTLIELMVVVAILAIIAGIAVPIYKDYISTSRNVEAFNNMSSLRLAEQEYYLENNKYAAGTYDATGGHPDSLYSGGLGWSPSEPASKQNFWYKVATTASDTSITSISAYGLGRSVPTSVSLTLQ